MKNKISLEEHIDSPYFKSPIIPYKEKKLLQRC
jgi:hypothetical protein